MKFFVNSRIFEKFPDLYLGVVIALGLDNRRGADELWPLISAQQEEIRASTDSETLSQNPRIAAWRGAYSAFGAKPKKYKSSVESLYRMVIKGVGLRQINAIVDVYNYISIKHMVPVGGDDISRVEGDITLRFAHGGEMFRPLNSEEVEHAKEDEVIYTDNVEVLCRRWNWRECDKTKMTEETKEAMLVVEGLPPVNREEVDRIVEELRRLVERFCGGETRFEILHEEQPEIVISPRLKKES
jgi:DNA/RNA-binding domain of Phe-tRNA-synthetase-like protein